MASVKPIRYAAPMGMEGPVRALLAQGFTLQQPYSWSQLKVDDAVQRLQDTPQNELDLAVAGVPLYGVTAREVLEPSRLPPRVHEMARFHTTALQGRLSDDEAATMVTACSHLSSPSLTLALTLFPLLGAPSPAVLVPLLERYQGVDLNTAVAACLRSRLLPGRHSKGAAGVHEAEDHVTVGDLRISLTRGELEQDAGRDA